PFRFRPAPAPAPLAQPAARLAQLVDRRADVERDDRFEDVELELPRLRGHRDRQVVPDYLEADLIDYLRDDRVHLSGHDARAGLHRRQVDLAETGARPAREEAQVVADLRELDGDALQHARELDERTGVRRRFDQVGARDEGQAGDVRQM